MSAVQTDNHTDYMLHLTKHDLHGQFKRMNDLVFYYDGLYNDDAMVYYKNDFDRKLLDTFDVNTEDGYKHSCKLLNQHFECCGHTNTFVHCSRSQEQYHDSVHYLNKRMMDGQQYRIHRKRIRLSKNEGTGNGWFIGVKYNEEERTFTQYNRTAVCQHESYQKRKKNVATKECAVEDTGTLTVDSCTIHDNAVDDSTIVETTPTTELKPKLNLDVNDTGTTTTTTSTPTVAPSTCENVNDDVQTNTAVARYNDKINVLNDEVVEEDDIVSAWEDINAVSESKQNTFSSKDDSVLGNVVVIDLSDDNNKEGIQLQRIVTFENESDQNNDKDKNGNRREEGLFSEEEGATRENIIDLSDEIVRDGEEEQIRNIDIDDDDDDDDNDEVTFIASTGKNALSDYPHSRENCVTHLLTRDPILFCPHCYCFVCDVKATECTKWDQHCQARRSDIKWRQRRSSVRSKRKAPERMAKQLSCWNSTNIVLGKRVRRTPPP